MSERIDYLGTLRRGWRLLLVLAVVGFIVAVVIPVSAPKATAPGHQYHWKASALVGVEPKGGLGPSDVNGETILFWANNYLVRTTAAFYAGFRSNAIPLSGLMSATPVAFPGTTSAKAKAKSAAGSDLIILTAREKTPASAAKVTNYFAAQVEDSVNKAFNSYQASLTKPPTSSSQTSGFEILEPALASNAVHLTFETAGVSSSRKVRGLAGIIIGLLLAALILLLRELLDRSIRTATGAEKSLQYPVLVEIPGGPFPKAAAQARVALAVVEEPNSPSAEAYRMLRMSIMFEDFPANQVASDPFGFGLSPLPLATAYSVPEPGTRQVVLVLSPGSEKTRPVVAVNLAATYAEAGQRAIVISTDDIGSGFARRSAEARSDRIEPDDIAAHLLPSSLPNVARLSLHPFVSSSGQLVTEAPAVLNAARQLADVIIVEVPPFLSIHHGEALVHAVDVVLVIAESGVTKLDEGRKTGELLHRLGAPVLGVALTNVRVSRRTTRQPTVGEDTEPASDAPEARAMPVPEATKA